MSIRTHIARMLPPLVLAVACGGSSSSTPAAEATAGAEEEEEVDTGPPPSAVEVAAGQASGTPTKAAVALAAVTSHAEPRQKIIDPVRVSPGIYKIVTESTRMRLLEATWEPGETDLPHGHPPLVAYALTDLEGIATGDTGKQKRIKLKAGAAFYQNPVKAHTFKNVGNKPARMLILELSQRVDPMPMPDGAAPDALKASPDVYRRVFEDEHIRVLSATWEPGKMDEKHSHPELAAYAITTINAKLHADDGTTHDLVRPAGGGVFQDPVKGHVYENVGKTPTQIVLFEPKGGAALASAADPRSFKKLPLESGDGEVTSFIDHRIGVRMDIGAGFTLEVPPGVEFSDVVTFSKTSKRPKNSLVAKGFSRHAQTLEFDVQEEKLSKQVILAIDMPRLPVKEGHRFVLAMEVSGECKGKARRHRLRNGGCSHWQLVPTMFDETRKKVIAKLGTTGGYRLQFGWVPN